MNHRLTPPNTRGFTLIEILVVISIVAVLSAVVGVSSLQSSQKSRDAKRQADLSTMQSAIELYKNKNGRYPAQCPTSGALANGWSGQQGTDYECTGGGTQYVVGLAPEFIPILPQDKKLNGTNSGYVYRTNTNGTTYKLTAMNTVESEVVTYSHKFSSCHIDPNNNASANIQVGGWCVNAHYSSGLPSQCQVTSATFQRSYAVWGGIAPLRAPANTSLSDPLTPLSNSQKITAVQDTTTVICR